ncbi:glycosyltransferase family 4 protein [Actinomadura luteofluorescens]|uniref:Glycosyltransferase involved in cell wall biosynthesis n=1 Tax=Actinomadura luteofluorescens TaxID=46163 RepID=A0A7Y9EFY6_9ACTN|nr:glycosyltransferase family 4 protein [Actinomadura luteofluorescens]NYD47013.1 glycosyltransferase involved in cell wall biosynthesis [Actinomadura luteofluorescens]
MRHQGPLRHRAAYVAFDRFPSSKGSAVHIAQMADELFTRFEGGLLAAIGGGDLPRYQREGTREVARFDAAIPNLIDRAEAFSGWVAAHLRPHWETLEVCHVRDPWSALPAVADGRRHTVVYEVNGLPSIEMSHTWPWAAPATLGKIRELERFCLERSDAVVVPSRVIGDAVRGLGVPEGRIHLVPNGADVRDRPERPAGAPERYLVYVGALQPWQGLDVLMRAFARLADLPGLRLVVCASVPERRAKPVRRLAERLGVAERVDWRFALPHHEVAAWLAHAEVSVAPLTGCARNLDQGCAPLKVIESMAAGVPVVASDLPAVRELMADGRHGRLVPADRPAELARAVRILLEYPEEAAAMGRRGRAHIEESLTWARSRARLTEVYRTLTRGR